MTISFKPMGYNM